MHFSDFLAEANKNKTIVFAFGRFNPPTIGHGLLVKKVVDTAKKLGADHVIYASRSQDSKKNPLSVQQKIKYLRKMFSYANFEQANEDVRTFIEVAKHLSKQKYSKIIMVAGSDRITEYQKLFDKFVEKLKALEVVRVWEDKEKFNPDSGNNWYVAPACKHFSLFVSLDSVDKQAEYIRTGLEYNRLVNNVKHFLTETHGTEVTFINTFNLLSIPKLKDFLQLILDLRVEFGYENQNDHVIQPPDNNGIVHSPFIRKKRQRVWFDIPYLRHPDWMSAQLAAFDPELLDTLNECLQFMEDNVENENYGRTYHGFKKYEIAKLKRNIAWISNGKNDINDEELVARQRHFWRYFMTIDKRRDLNFIETFPELTNWWINCYRAIQNEKK
jgi:nicotinic acid mononucleotide adenylyltransferase